MQKSKEEFKKKTSKNNLRNERILKKNLLFLIGLPPYFNNRELLLSQQFLGQYGEILDLYIKEDLYQRRDRSFHKSISVYVIFNNEIATAMAILALDKHKVNQNILKASFGRTRYCKFFIEGIVCKNKSCKFVHSKLEQEICFDVKDKEKEVIKRVDIIEALMNTKEKWQTIKEKYSSTNQYAIFPSFNQAIIKVENHYMQLKALQKQLFQNPYSDQQRHLNKKAKFLLHSNDVQNSYNCLTLNQHLNEELKLYSIEEETGNEPTFNFFQIFRKQKSRLNSIQSDEVGNQESISNLVNSLEKDSESLEEKSKQIFSLF